MRNSIGNLPLRRKPWEYLIHGGLVSYIFYRYPSWERSLLIDINVMRQELGLSRIDTSKSRGEISKELLGGQDLLSDTNTSGANKYIR